MSADYTPSMHNYKNMGHFKMWCQKVLPLVYDDSLSYYEVLCKVIQYINDTTDNVDGLYEDMQDLYEAYNLLQSYVNNYFDNLNVQTEINNKLDAMVLDGTMDELLSPIVSRQISGVVAEQIGDVVGTQIGAVVANQLPAEVATQLPDIAGQAASTEVGSWLETHIDPDTGYVIDDSLTVSNAAADAKAVGDNLTELNSALTNFFVQPSYTYNDTSINASTGYIYPLTDTKVQRYGIEKGKTYVINCVTGNRLIALSNDVYDGELQFATEYHYLSANAITYRNEMFDYLYVLSASSGSDKNVSVYIDANADIDKVQENLEDVAYIDFSELSTTIISGKMMTYVGNITTQSGYCVTDYIDISKYATVKVSGRSNYGNGIACFFDENKTFVSCSIQAASGSANTTVTNQEIPVPIGAKYIVVGGREGSSAAYTPRCYAKVAYKLKKWKDKVWLAFGDSLTDARNAKATKRYFDYVQDATSITVLNGGVSGSGYCVDGEAALGEDTNWRDRILTYADTDFDVITLFGSFNDLGSGLPTGTASDSTTATKAGCINITLDNLFSIKPLAIVGVVTPTPWETAYPGDTAADNYVNVLKEICQKRGIPCLDLFHESLLRPWDATFRTLAYSRDGGYGVHPDENGHKMIAPRFEAFLDSLLLH